MSLQVAPINGTHIHYCQTGPKDGPALVFSNSLGTDLRIWNDVAPAFADRFNVITYDKRGHGLSGIGGADYNIDLHANDLIGLLDYLGVKDVIICGLSVGGLIAQKVTELAPERVRGLILCDTAPKLGDADGWNTRINAIKEGGIEVLGDAIIERWLSPTYRRDRPVETAMYRDMLVRTTVEGYVGTCIALRDGGPSRCGNPDFGAGPLYLRIGRSGDTARCRARDGRDDPRCPIRTYKRGRAFAVP